MISIKNIESTRLDKQAFEKLAKKYLKSCKNVKISFDGRMKDYGSYFYLNGSDIIKISNILHKHENACKNGKLLSKEVEITQLISTFLHEIRHQQQRKKLKNGFYADKHHLNSSLKEDKYYANHYSELEVDARAYEEINILKAMKFYWSQVEKCK